MQSTREAELRCCSKQGKSPQHRTAEKRERPLVSPMRPTSSQPFASGVSLWVETTVASHFFVDRLVTLKNILELENYNDYVIIALAKLEGRFQGFANPMQNKQSRSRYHCSIQRTTVRATPCRSCEVKLANSSLYIQFKQYHTVPYRTIPYHTIPYHTIQYNRIQSNPIPQYNTIE